jgi:iron complex transport system substrate-binding protein
VRRFWIPLILLLLIGGAALADGYPVTIVDGAGREVLLTERPRRILSGTPSCTEILFAVGAGDQVVGVTRWCNYPEAAKEKEDIGDIVPLNVEKVLARNPDLVLLQRLNGKEALDKLEELGIPVLVLEADSFTGILEAITMVGEATGHRAEAEELAFDLAGRLAAVKAKARKNLKVLILLSGESLWTAGPGSFLDEAVALAGGQNVAYDLDGSWGEISLEVIIKRNPDVIITSSPVELVYGNGLLSTLAAVEKRQVYQVDGDAFHRAGPRLFAVLEELSGLLQESQ